MRRAYAGILGLIAFITVTIRAVIHGGAVDATVTQACMALILFAVFGFIAGWIAEHTVSESVRWEIQAEWDEVKRNNAADSS